MLSALPFLLSALPFLLGVAAFLREQLLSLRESLLLFCQASLLLCQTFCRVWQPKARAIIPAQPKPVFVVIAALPQAQPEFESFDPEPALMIRRLLIACAYQL